MRRLPIYFLIDIGGNSREAIHAINNAIHGLLGTLRCDPAAIESIWVSIISFNSETKENMPLSSLQDSFQWQEITIETPSGPKHTGKALSFLIQAIEPQLKKRPCGCSACTPKKPLIFLFTHGSPNDMELYNKMCSILFSSEFGIKIACIVNSENDNSNLSWIKLFSDTIVKIPSLDSESIFQFFKWASQLIIAQLADDDDIFDTTTAPISKLFNH